jgi:hypothetical protein
VAKGFGEGDHIYVFDTASGDLVSEFDLKTLPDEAGNHNPPFFFVGSRDQWLLSGGGGEKRRLYLWDWRAGKVVRVIEGQRDIEAPLSVSSDGQLVAADVRGDEDVAMYFPIRDYKIFDVVTGKEVYQSPTYRWADRWGKRPEGTHVVQLRLEFSGDGNYIVDASGYDEVVIYSISR